MEEGVVGLHSELFEAERRVVGDDAEAVERHAHEAVVGVAKVDGETVAVLAQLPEALQGALTDAADGHTVLETARGDG